MISALGGHWVVLVGPGHDPEDARGEHPTRENKRFRIATASETAFYSRKAALRGHLVVLVASGETPADLCCCLSKRTHENPAGEGGAKTCKFFVCPSSKNASFCSGRPLGRFGRLRREPSGAVLELKKPSKTKGDQ